MEQYHNFGWKLLRLVALLAILFFYQQQMELREARAEAAENAARAEAAKLQLNELGGELDKITAEVSKALGKEDADGFAGTVTDGAAGYQDGTYSGEGTGFGGSIQVEVTVKDGKIESLEILSAAKEDSAYLESAKGVIDRVLEAQTPEVDAISGATFSSKGILKAAGNALASAGQSQAAVEEEKREGEAS